MIYKGEEMSLNVESRIVGYFKGGGMGNRELLNQSRMSILHSEKSSVDD